MWRLPIAARRVVAGCAPSATTATAGRSASTPMWTAWQSPVVAPVTTVFVTTVCRSFSEEAYNVTRLRNIGISAHIDSGKTTLTERVLFYTGRINSIHDVRGKDGVGAKMDSMELEREKGITIQSAATYCTWGDCNINIIDTPGHVDFTVEVERALRVLDGAVLVLCAVSGVQSQSITVDRQMKRYNVPRVAFINKMDRQGADPYRVTGQLIDKLKLNAAMVQVPLGTEDKHRGAVCLLTGDAYEFHGDNGENLVKVDVPDDLKDVVAERRHELIERLAEVDEDIEELYLMEETPDPEAMADAIRKATIALNFVPVFVGSAFKNKGVQLLLDGVVDYLPNPTEVPNIALDRDDNEKEVVLRTSATDPLVALAFKLEESRFGQLTYLRLYQGSFKRGEFIYNIDDHKSRVKVPRVVKLHSDEMEDIDEAQAGEIVAMFGVDCSSGDTFTDGNNLAMTSMFVPEPVISYAVHPKASKDLNKFSKALQRFQREDPTFRVHVDGESKETIISGMGELHLDIYVERMKREYDVDVTVGEPQVNFRETITKRAEFNYLHKKQSGGSGQYGRVIGYIEPLENGVYEFENAIIGNAIPPEYITAIDKGFQEGIAKGPMLGHPVQGVRCVLTDGQAHAVDSSEMAFKIAGQYAFREAFKIAAPGLLEPIMKVEVSTPDEFQSTVIGGVNQRKGSLQNTEMRDGTTVIEAEVPLSNMFGYSTTLRSTTQGKAEFTMEYSRHDFAPRDTVDRLVREAQARHEAELKK